MAQNITLNRDASPIGGNNNLALPFHLTDFNKEQRSRIGGMQLEFIFNVDTSGNAALTTINGIKDQDLLDSLTKRAQHIPKFLPQIQNGKAIPSLYFLGLIFPKHKFQYASPLRSETSYKKPSMTDFEYIHKSNEQFDVVISILMSQFAGIPADHLKLGSGVKTDINFTNKNRYIFGTTVSLYGNNLKKDYPINDPINNLFDQNNNIATYFMGLHAGKWFGKVNTQLELNYFGQFIIVKQSIDNDPVTFHGFSPGLVFNYPIQIGRDRLETQFPKPMIYEHCINLHFGIRSLLSAQKLATGLAFEIGIGYRLESLTVRDYKLKDNFFK